MDYNQIIDGHTDVLLALQQQQRRKFSEESNKGHVDYPRMREGNVVAAFFAIWPGNNDYYIKSGVRRLLDFADNPENKIQMIKQVQDFKKLEKSKNIGLIFHIEGVGGLDADFNMLHILYRLGLRSIGITWSNYNKFASGSSFNSQAPEDTRGVTAEGKELIHEAQNLGIIIDVSHLSDKSFWDVMDITEKPVIASHSSCRAISPHSRNLTDKMIKALADIDGVMGINFSNSFLRPDCKRNTDTPISLIVDHIDHVKELVGVNHVAFGSDFDGTTVSEHLPDVTGFNLILEEMEERGYTKNEIAKITHGNFMRIFKSLWK